MDDKTSQILASYLASVEGGSNLDAFTAAAWWDAVLERSYFGLLQEYDTEVNQWIKENIGMVIDVFTRSDRGGVKALGMKYGGLYGRISVPDLLTEMKTTGSSTVFTGCLHGLEGRHLIWVIEFIESALDRRISVEADVFSKLILFSSGNLEYRRELEAVLDAEAAISSRLAAKVAFVLCRFGSSRGKIALMSQMENKKIESSVALEAMIQLGATEASWRTFLSDWLTRIVEDAK